jgi:hypothetical protein
MTFGERDISCQDHGNVIRSFSLSARTGREKDDREKNPAKE